jgi:hypothetical protein
MSSCCCMNAASRTALTPLQLGSRVAVCAMLSALQP